MSEAHPDIYSQLRLWIKRHLGIVYTADQNQQLVDRLKRFAASKRLTPETLLEALQRGDSALTCELAEVMSTNYTFFMREPETLDFLRDHVLPAYPEGELRIWSAATSSGDEAYSAAICCLERFGPEARQRVKILGTDISQRQIDFAEAGIYPAEQLTRIDATRRTLWFTPIDNGRRFQVRPVVHELCTFRRMNLTQIPWPFERRFQVILLRNVLYYLERPMCQRVLEACYDVTAPGGWLITSITEPIMDIKTRWRRVAPAIYRRGST